jgi:hypothetical protein
MRKIEMLSTGTRGFHHQQKAGGKLMYVKRAFSILTIVIAMAAMLTGVRAQSGEKADKPQSTETGTTLPPSPLGTWNVNVFTDDGFRFKQLMTFTPGRTSDEGALIQTSSIDFTPPPCITQQGVWVKTSDLHYATTSTGFCFDDAPGNPNGFVKLRSSITLGTGGNGFVGQFKVDVYDAAGNLVFTGGGKLRGTRAQVEPLP